MAYKILIFCLFVIAAEAKSKVGSERCTWGPSYWCQTYEQAKGCNAVEHCIRQVWLKQLVGNDCDTCQEVVKKVEVFLSNKTVQAEIIKFLEQVCDDVAGPFAGPCKAAVDADGPKIINSLAGLLSDSFSVCAALDLCTTKDILSARPLPVFMPGPVMIEKKPAEKKKSVKSTQVEAGPECALCEFVMKELDSLLSDNSTEQEVIAALNKVCSLLPSTIESECEQLVKEYGPAIIQLIVQELKDPSQICTELGLCTSTKVVTKKQVKSGELCEVCQLAMQYLDQELGQNATEQEIIKVLDEVCAALPPSMSLKCKQLVSQYADEIIKLIVEELKNPKEICTLLGLCTSNKAVPKKQVKSGELCEVCKLAIGYLKQELSQNATEQEVKQLLDELCEKLPSSISSECTALVDEYADQIIQLVVSELDADQICRELGLCTSAAKCHLGPSYWCKNKQTAIACQAVKHCVNFVWK